MYIMPIDGYGEYLKKRFWREASMTNPRRGHCVRSYVPFGCHVGETIAFSENGAIVATAKINSIILDTNGSFPQFVMTWDPQTFRKTPPK